MIKFKREKTCFFSQNSLSVNSSYFEENMSYIYIYKSMVSQIKTYPSPSSLTSATPPSKILLSFSLSICVCVKRGQRASSPPSQILGLKGRSIFPTFKNKVQAPMFGPLEPRLEFYLFEGSGRRPSHFPQIFSF